MISRPVRSLLVLATIAGLTTGCVKTRVANVARMDAPTTQRSAPVRYAGEYVAKWTPSDRKHLKTIPGSSRLAHPGDQLGFEYSPDGQLIGLHGDARVTLADLPANATYVVWQNKQVVPTQFSREMKEVGEAAGQVAEVALLGTVYVGLLLINASLDDDCDDDDSFPSFSRKDRDRHHKHKHRKTH